VIHLVGLDDPRLGFSSAQTIPASTALVTCSPVAFCQGASPWASSFDSRDPYQSAFRACP
jgi:hypothetical protein